jgi:hypothetical protein
MLRVYQYLAPAILAPLSWFLWWQTYQRIDLVMMAWLIPIVWAYVVPAVGTNVLKVWEFNVAWKLGNFRPHHGFVFGSATSTLTWLVHGAPVNTLGAVPKFGLIVCSLLAFWNLLYEIKALRIGLLRVYNQPWAEKRDVEAIALDYSPWFFGGFGFAYGSSLAGLEYWVSKGGPASGISTVAYLLVAEILCIALPVLGFMQHSFRAHGHFGTRPIKRAH